MILRASDHQAIMVSLDFEYQKLEIDPVIRIEITGWGTAISPPELKSIDYYRKNLNANTNYHLRCFTRAEFFEVYLDDELIFSVAACDAARNGDVGLFVERGQASFHKLRLAKIEPL